MILTKRFSVKITKKQCTEFGQAATVVVLIFALHYKNDHWVTAALGLTLTTIVLPVIFYPLAIVWFALAELLSIVAPAILLTVIYFLIVTPIGLIRRLLGKDSMRLRQFKQSSQSLMITRNHLFAASDLLHTF